MIFVSFSCAVSLLPVLPPLEAEIFCVKATALESAVEGCNTGACIMKALPSLALPEVVFRAMTTEGAGGFGVLDNLER